MATIVVPKRSARLKSREHSVTVLPETKRKPRKVTTADKVKSPQKVNVIARRLRPRQSKRNYYNDSKLLQKHVPVKQHGSVVILQKLDLENQKVPIYKTLGSEKSLEEKNDVYDFKFDANDTKEKLKKKKKRKPKKKNVNKTNSKATNKTRVKKKVQLAKVETVRAVKEAESKKIEDICLDKIKTSRINADVQITKKAMKKDVDETETPRSTDIQIVEETACERDIVEPIETSRIDVQTAEESMKKATVDKAKTSKTDSIIQSIEDTTSPKKRFVQDRKQDMKKPKILSIENANNIIVRTETSSSNSEDSILRPFRSKNIFDNKITGRQSNKILSSSLLTKSLSPITKISNNLDFGSPWRSPTTIPIFSQSKHFVQSTPNVSMEIGNENMEHDKENIKINQGSKHRKNKEKKKKTDTLHKKHIVAKQFLTNQNSNKVQTVLATNTIEQPAPSRISLGKIRTLLQERPDKDIDNKQMINKTQDEADKSLVTQKDKHAVDYLNFSDTFDVMSETEKVSNLEVDVPLFADLEPSHFSRPPRHSYKRKRGVKFDLGEDSGQEGEEEKKDDEIRRKKKKVTKSEKEHQKRVNEWVKSMNNTFQEIDDYDLLIE